MTNTIWIVSSQYVLPLAWDKTLENRFGFGSSGRLRNEEHVEKRLKSRALNPLMLARLLISTRLARGDLSVSLSMEAFGGSGSWQMM